MIIDLTSLITNSKSQITFDIDVSFADELLNDTNIKKINNSKFIGKIKKLYSDEFEISGILSGTMILPDDITLEDTKYNFNTEIEEKFIENDTSIDNNLKIIQNKLDITDFLWQNILVEIPMKIVNKKNENLTIQGNGWRLTTEEELNKERESNNSPFKDLLEKFPKGRSE
ncbi:MAG: DUF177 domain-containing protein [Bacilli bacterium]|nr:DUF177 domain-containing protein [Bacilli bacterium]